MTARLRIGMIGLGGVATRSHLPALAALPEAVVQAGAEIDAYQAARTQQRFAIPRVYGDYQEMLEKEPLDAVYVCLPNTLHHQAASAALARGLHVYCEKPVGLSAGEAQDLADQAGRAGLVLMPGYHLRFHEHFTRARDLLANRRLGRIIQVQASAVYSGPYRGWDPKSDWYFDPRSGGPLYDWGSHLLDLLACITRVQIDSVFAAAQKSLPGIPLQDSIAAVFQARNEIVGTINLAWGTRGNLLLLQVHGTAGSLLVSDDYFEHRAPTGGGLNKIGTLLGNTQEILANKAGAALRRRSKQEIYTRAAAWFVDAIRGRVQAGPALADAVQIHRVLAAIACSIERGEPAACAALPTGPVEERT